MSQYLNIYLKHNETYIPLMDYSRSTEIYQEFDAPFEKLREYSPHELSEVGARLQRKVEDAKKEIQKFQEQIELIPHFTGATILDRLDSITSAQECIEDLNEEIETYKTWANICYFLSDVADNFESGNSIWAGIEAYPDSKDE